MAVTAERRVDLDWIRIVAFLTLILYHVGMYYVSWDWHVKSPFASATLEPLMFFTNPWRLGLLFVVSGAATAFMIRRLPPGALARTRSWRLLVPLLFGMFVIVPPQSYLEVVERRAMQAAFAEFYLRYVAADRTFCRGNDCLIIPTWNHLWFVAYLWAYTMVIAGILAWREGWRERWAARLERRIAGWGILLWPWLVLAVFRVGLVGSFPSTHALVDDWYNHALYFTLFAFGFVAAHSAPVWDAMDRVRWVALALAFASYAFIAWYFSTYSDKVLPPEALRTFQRVIYALNQWSWIVAACAFAHRYIRSDGPARRYLTDAIFPFYIIHQTAIILFAVWMRPLGLAPLAEGLLLVAATAVACVGTYEIVKRADLLRPLFGLKRAAR
jgi:hypothetical protein